MTPAMRRRSVPFLVAVTACVVLVSGATPAGATSPDPPEVSASGAVLWDPADDLVLFGKDEEVGRPMASTTKIMTVLLAIESGNVDELVTVSPAAAALGEATLNLRAGQRVPMESLAAGLLLRSGNDAALALAEHVAGSEEAFVERMNVRAEELGLQATRFVNPSGLTNDLGHRASPLDLARLADVAMRHEVFARYAGAAEATVPGIGAMTSRNELLGAYPHATGVKTGFTTLAGLCLVASAERDGRTLYAVVLDSADSFTDTAALLDWGFEAFRRVELLADGMEVTRYRWAGAEVALLAAAGLGRTVAADAEVAWRTVLDVSADRPVMRGDRLGTAQLRVDGAVVDETALEAADDVDRRAPGSAAATVGAAVQDALRAFARLSELDRVA